MSKKTALLSRAAFAAVASISTFGWSATLTWDANGVAPLGGAGTWDTTAANWLDGTYKVWNNTGQVNPTTDDAVFNTTAGAVTVQAGGVTARSLRFDIGGYALSGGAVTLSGGTVINTNHSTSATGTFATGANVTTTSSIISGSGGLTKQGTGVLSVNSAAGYTGATVVSGGVLRMGVANALPSATLLEVQTGAALDLGGNSNVAAGFNLEVAGLTGAGRITTGQNNNPGTTLTVNIAASRTDTFSGIFGGSQAGIAGNSFNQIHFAKSGIGTLVMSGTNGTATSGNGPANNVTVSGGILQLGSQTAFTAVGWDLNTVTVGTGATFDMKGFNEGFSGTSGVGVVTNTSLTQSVMSRNRTAGTNWAAPITGNIRIQANTADVTLSSTSNSFTGGVDLTGGGGAFIINNAGQLPANQIDLANGGNLDFLLAGGLTLAADRTFTIGAGTSNFRYKNTAAGVVNLAGAINNGASPGTLVLSYHTSVVGNTTFGFSGGGSFTGTTQIGASHASPQSVTLRPGVANGIATGTIIDFGGGNGRTYSLDLNGFSQQVAGLRNTGTGTSLV